MGIELSYVGFCRFARRLLGIKHYALTEGTRAELRRAGLELRDEEFAAGLLLSLLLPLSLTLLLCLLLLPRLGFSVLFLFMAGTLFFCLPAFLFFQLYPSIRAGQRVSRARGEAVNTVLILCVNLLHHSDLRSAMAQASNTGGKLASDLRRALLGLERGEFQGAKEALLHLSREWRELDETVSEALLDVVRSQGSGEPSRELERAVDRFVEEVRRETEEGLGRMISPTIYFLSFGSLATVLVIGMSPLFGMVGLGLSLPLYLLLVGSLALAFWIFVSLMLRRRPLVLPPPPAAPGSTRRALLASLLFLGFSLVFFRSPLWILWAGAFAVFLFCSLKSWPALRVRKREQRIRREWRRAVSFLGERMGEGRSFGEAIREAGDVFPGVGPQLKKVYALMQAKSLDPYRAFFEEGNAPSDPLASGILEASLALRRRSEAAAASALRAASEMVCRLEREERRFGERMREAVSNLWMICLVLLPLVCSVSVWVVGTFTRLASSLPQGFFLSPSLSSTELPLLSLLMGLLSLVLSLSVARYIAGITLPGDGIELASCVGRVSLVSTSLYLASLLLFSGLAG
ncbi:MAG: hypothetical protein QXH26_00030 [Candidatus Hadarchaeales archaeon]